MTAVDEAKLITSKIVSGYNPEKVILFGSTARGTRNSESDIDLLIIKDTNKKRPFRVKEVLRLYVG